MLLFVEEDHYGTYAKVMSKYFMAESVVTSQPLLVASKDVKPSHFVADMPAVITDSASTDQPRHPDEQMQIAWRYQNMKVIDSASSGGQTFGHSYDPTKTMEKETIEKANITQWYDDSCPTRDDVFENSSYTKLLKCVQETLKKGEYSISKTPAKRQVLRIAIHSLGSRLWFADSENSSQQDLLKFLYLLRSLLRYSYAVAVITVPAECLSSSVSFTTSNKTDFFMYRVAIYRITSNFFRWCNKLNMYPMLRLD